METVKELTAAEPKLVPLTPNSANSTRRRKSNINPYHLTTDLQPGQSHWRKVDVLGHLPARRSNAACCIADDGFLYVHGGNDLKEGLLSDLWRVNLSDALAGRVQWEDMTT